MVEQRRRDCDRNGNGLVTAISAGEAAITAKTPSGLSDSCAVTVKEMADKPALIINKDVYFGQYEQNANDEDGKEPIQWRVLSNDGDNVLLLSERYSIFTRSWIGMES